METKLANTRDKLKMWNVLLAKTTVSMIWVSLILIWFSTLSSEYGFNHRPSAIDGTYKISWQTTSQKQSDRLIKLFIAEPV